MNHVLLIGRLSSMPQRRELASGSSLWSLELTTDTSEGAWSVPIAWFDPPVEPAFLTGDEVMVLGSVRRRFFRSASGTQSRTEVVASEVVAATATRKVKALLRRETKRLGAVVDGEVRSA
jgi:single-stranded DNA-binding protein